MLGFVACAVRLGPVGSHVSCACPSARRGSADWAGPPERLSSGKSAANVDHVLPAVPMDHGLFLSLEHSGVSSFLEIWVVARILPPAGSPLARACLGLLDEPIDVTQIHLDATGEPHGGELPGPDKPADGGGGDAEDGGNLLERQETSDGPLAAIRAGFPGLVHGFHVSARPGNSGDSEISGKQSGG
jgi:hypothetical protein